MFADVFYRRRADGSVRGGFDLVVGNPPWVKVRWDEKAVLGEFDPVVEVQTIRPRDASRRVEEAVAADATVRHTWFAEMEATAATKTFLNATQNYPLLKGQQTNLYKCFLPQAWRVAGWRGVVGMLHPEGPYEDPNAGIFRAALYSRLRGHFQFINERKLFPEVDHHTKFSINIYGCERGADGDGGLGAGVSFAHISNLFAPGTLDACLEHDGRGPVPGVKDDQGQWNVAGHRHRMIRIESGKLEMFAALYDEPDTPALEARLPRAPLQAARFRSSEIGRSGDISGGFRRPSQGQLRMARKRSPTRRYDSPPNRLHERPRRSHPLGTALLLRQSLVQDSTAIVREQQRLRRAGA